MLIDKGRKWSLLWLFVFIFVLQFRACLYYGCPWKMRCLQFWCGSSRNIDWEASNRAVAIVIFLIFSKNDAMWSIRPMSFSSGSNGCPWYYSHCNNCICLPTHRTKVSANNEMCVSRISCPTATINQAIRINLTKTANEARNLNGLWKLSHEFLFSGWVSFIKRLGWNWY